MLSECCMFAMQSEKNAGRTFMQFRIRKKNTALIEMANVKPTELWLKEFAISYEIFIDVICSVVFYG